MSNSNKVSVKEGSWQQLKDICSKLRQASLEPEKLAQLNTSSDASSRHLLMAINNQPVACARLTSSNQLEAVAVLPQLKNKGLEEQLEKLAAAKQETQTIKEDENLEIVNPSSASTNANQATTYYTQQELESALQTNKPLQLIGKQQLDLALDILIASASKFVYFQADSYPRNFFNEDQARQLSSLARRHAFAQVSFLLNDGHNLTAYPNALKQVYQRASSNFAIYQSPRANNPKNIYLLIDESHLLTLPDPNEEVAWLHPNKDRQAFIFLNEFKDKWPRAVEIKGLHELNI